MVLFTIVVGLTGGTGALIGLALPYLYGPWRATVFQIGRPLFLGSLLACLFAEEFAAWLRQRAPQR